jgi:hypothetical protein
MTTIVPAKNRRRKWIYILISLAVIVLADQLCVWWNRRITAGYATTRITAPMQGMYPDYLGSLNRLLSDGVTDDNNAAPLLLTVGGINDATPEWQAAVEESLGFTAQPALVTNYVSWALRHAADASKQTAQTYEDELDQVRKGPWNAAKFPLVAQWLQASAPGLAKMELALRRPRFYVPLTTNEGLQSGAGDVTMLNVTIPWLAGFRTMADLLAMRSLNRLEAGDAAGFSADVLRMIQLSRLVDQMRGADIIVHLIGVAIDSNAMMTVQHAVVSGLLHAPDADNLRKAIEAIPPLANLDTSIDLGGRYCLLDVICSLRKKCRDDGIGMWLNVYPLSYDALLRRANDIHDRLIDAANLPDFEGSERALNAIEREILALSHKGLGTLWHPYDDILTRFSANVGNCHVYQTRCWQERDLALTALALVAAKTPAGYPASLDDLQARGFTPPLDRFTNQPLIYRRTVTGCIVYSVGENLADDGGVRREDVKNKQSQKWDISVEFRR